MFHEAPRKEFCFFWKFHKQTSIYRIFEHYWVACLFQSCRVTDNDDDIQIHCFRSRFDTDLMDPDLESELGPGSRRAKMTHKRSKKLRNFMFWRTGCSFLRPVDFFCIADVLFGGIWFRKCNFFGYQNSGSRINKSGSETPSHIQFLNDLSNCRTFWLLSFNLPLLKALL